MKVLILTDSIGNPRPIPVSEATQLEETFPYLLRESFKDAVFWQLSFGNITTEQLIDQAISYLSTWEPDVIIVQSGINDARPEAFTELQKAIVEKMSGRFFSKLRAFVYRPSWIKTRQVSRVTQVSFRKTARKLKLIFEGAQILWLEISALDGYENARPGVHKRLTDYNAILEEIYQDGFVKIKEPLAKKEGFNSDHFHWNKQGHRIVADLLINKIRK